MLCYSERCRPACTTEVLRLDADQPWTLVLHPNALQLAAISDSNAAIVKAAALAAYNQAVNQASTTAASERATAFQLFATSVSQSRATEAAVLSQLKHPTIDIGTESQGYSLPSKRLRM